MCNSEPDTKNSNRQSTRTFHPSVKQQTQNTPTSTDPRDYQLHPQVCVHTDSLPSQTAGSPLGAPLTPSSPVSQAKPAGRMGSTPSTVQREMAAAGGTHAYKPKHCCLYPIKRLQEAEEHTERCRVVPVGNILFPKAADTAMVSGCFRYAEHLAHTDLRGQPNPPSSASPCRTGRPLTRLYGHALKMPVNESFWCKSHSYPVHIYRQVAN